MVVALSVKVNDMVAAANARVRLISAHVRPRGRRQNRTTGYRTRGLNQGRFD
jgi:hypothetical protein